jgi:hypothetical protein
MFAFPCKIQVGTFATQDTLIHGKNTQDTLIHGKNGIFIMLCWMLYCRTV